MARAACSRRRSEHDRRELAEVQTRLLDNPRDAEALLGAGEILYRMGEYKQAEAHLGRAMISAAALCDGVEAPHTSPSQVARVLKRLGDCRVESDDVIGAERLYHAAAAVEPDWTGPYLGLGALALQQGRLEPAEVSFTAAVEIDPNSSEAYCGLGITRQRLGQYRRAFKMYLECIARDGENLLALLGLFQVSNLMGSFEEIINYLRAYLDKHPDDASVLFCLGTLYARQGDLRRARAAATKALRICPDKTQVRNLIDQLDRAQCGRHAPHDTDYGT